MNTPHSYDMLYASTLQAYDIMYGSNKFKLYIFYNDYETSYTTYINHARWHLCLRSGGLRVGGNWSARRKPNCLTW